MNIASKNPRSMVRPMCCQYSGREKCQPTLSFGCRHIPVAWLLTPCWMKPRRWAFFLSGVVMMGLSLRQLCGRLFDKERDADAGRGDDRQQRAEIDEHRVDARQRDDDGGGDDGNRGHSGVV